MNGMYNKLGAALGINTVLMFLISYSMLADFGHFHMNLNRFYMAIMMAAPMGIIMLLLMRKMYPNQKLNRVLFGVLSLLFLLSYGAMRTQTTIGDNQFLRSMIPHHSSAILMCDEPELTDPAIIELCRKIVETQKREIAEMETMLGRD